MKKMLRQDQGGISSLEIGDKTLLRVDGKLYKAILESVVHTANGSFFELYAPETNKTEWMDSFQLADIFVVKINQGG